MVNCINAYCEKSTLEKLFSQMKGITKIHEFDDFGMLRKTDIHQCGKSILSNKLNYKTRADDKYTSTQVASETMSVNNTKLTNRSYTTDAIGQVTSITDKIFGSHTYTYDHNGYLIKADDTTYSYDRNGNITQIGDKVLTYDTTIKDRLKSYDGNEITYDTNNPFNVASYKDKQFSYEGRRLVKVSNSSGYIEYKYNDQGMRILKKDYRGVGTNFEYDGDKLIYQYNSDGRLDFLYDENGELYGFIKDSQDKYFYVRDYLKNILGIVDISGNLVVKYSYDAYGKCTLVSDTSNASIGRINPFRFKGYYLDGETGFYYCNSRYYVPEWGRWFTTDSINYLDPASVNGMNLYAYCYNNPINYYDPSGHIALKLIFAFISGIMGLVSELVEDYIKDKSIFNGDKDGYDYLGAFVGGAISGFGTGFISSVICGTIGDIVDSAINGELKEQDNFGKFFGLSILANAAGYGIGKLFGSFGRKIASKIKATKIFKMKGHFKNNVINKILRPIANDLNIGAKKATRDYIAKEIFSANKWRFGIILDEVIQAIF